MRGRRLLLATSLAVMALASPAVAADKASAVLKDAQGAEVGNATFTTTPSGVLISLASPPFRRATTLSISTPSANASRPNSSRPAPISILTRPSMA